MKRIFNLALILLVAGALSCTVYAREGMHKNSAELLKKLNLSDDKYLIAHFSNNYEIHHACKT